MPEKSPESLSGSYGQSCFFWMSALNVVVTIFVGVLWTSYTSVGSKPYFSIVLFGYV